MLLSGIYIGEEWAYINKVYIKFSDDEIVSYETMQVKREVLSGGNVLEVVGFLLGDAKSASELIRKIADSVTEVKVRLSGSERNADFTISQTQKTAFKRIINKYDELSR